MTSGALKKLTIEHLRGSVAPFSIPFENGKKLAVIYGQNGAGKSTICDALEFLGKGKVGSLENRGLGRPSKYWHSLGKRSADVSVSLETTDFVCRATIGRTEVIVNPPELRPRVEVLRRSQILSLVEATPAHRYGAISRFVDVSGVEASEAALRQAIREMTNNRDVAKARMQESEGTIRQFWEAAGKPAQSPFIWAETQLSPVANTYDSEITALGELQAAYARLTDYPARLKFAEQALKAARDSLAAMQRRAEEVLQTISQDAGETVAVLEAARAYLNKHPLPASCPVCESREKTTGLADRIAGRLSVYSSLQTVQSQTKMTELAVQRAEQQWQVLVESAKKHIGEFEKCRARYQWPDDVLLPYLPPPNDPAALQQWLEATVHLPGEWRQAEASRHDKKQFLSGLQKAVKTCRDNVHAHREVQKRLPRLKKTLQIVEEERRRFTDEILATIADEVGRMYERVHPGEGLNKISLELDPAKRASLEMSASFCGQSTPPQAYFSDSHLDTLGLCVFIALAALDRPGNTILILDDVLGSVDEAHIERLIEMLHSEASRFRHCIITTHYRPWKQKFRQGWLQNGHCQFMELGDWTAASGLQLVSSVLEN